MEKNHTAQLIEGPIGKTLVVNAIPMIFGILAAIAFNLVDVFFVGQLGAIELAAISFTFPVVFVFAGISFGLGVGTSAVISRAIGEKDQYKVKRLTTDSLILSLLIVALFLILGLITIDPVFLLLGAGDQILPLIREYMKIWYMGMIFLVVPIIGNNAIRATGDTKTPSIIMLVAVLTNIILDPLLIFGLGPFPRLELAGAAIATVIARAITLFYSIYILYYREKMISLEIPQFAEILNSWRKILYIGIPSAGSNILRPLAAGVITRLVASFGPEAVAAFGVATRIDLLAMTVIMALSSILGPFIGQNMGAKLYQRVRLGIKFSHKFAMIWGLIVLALLLLLTKPLAPLFNENPKVIYTLSIYLWIVPFGYGLYGIFSLSNSALNILNKPLIATLLTIIQLFVFLIPLSYIGANFFNLHGIFASIAIANIISGLVALLWLRKILAKEIF